MSDRAVPSPVARWLRFNAVGVAGVALQLGVLAILTRLAGWHYFPATVVAVELTVLHNLGWHERWTWRDRPAGSAGGRLARAARFHAVNGAVSLGGNVLLMWLLAGRLGVDPIVANLLAVSGCSVVNFLGSDRLVFTRSEPGPPSTPAVGHRRTAGAAMALVVLTLLPVQAAGDGPVAPATLAAWATYERQVDARYDRDTSSPFFAADALGGPGSWRSDAMAGTIPMFQARSAARGSSSPDVPDGRIHHWVGATFVPGATVAGVIASLEAHAGQESTSYDDVIASRLLSRDGDRVTAPHSPRCRVSAGVPSVSARERLAVKP